MRRSDARDVDCLSATERELLALLGRGHTAKSIAHLKGLSEAAVNERFRAARRKTGLGSSREIARLIVAQENRHDFIAVAPEAQSAETSRRSDAPRRVSPYRRWSFLMVVSVLLASALFAQQTSVPLELSGTGLPVPPAAQALFETSSSPDMAALHAQIAEGHSDPAWTPHTEAALLNVYAHAALAQNLASFDVTCSAELCQVMGVSAATLPVAERERILVALQDRDVQEASRSLGLQHVAHGFSSGPRVDGDPHLAPLAFVVYWRRAR